MNIREHQNKIKSERGNRPRQPLNVNRAATLILTIVATLAVVVGVRAVEVSSRSKSGSVIQVPGDFATIQAAIDASRPGDIVEVEAGVYRENLTLNKPITLVAEKFDEINPVNNTTILDGRGRGTTILIPAGLAQMPVVRGFIIRNGVDNLQAASRFLAEYNYFEGATNLVSYQQGSGGFNRNNVYFGARDNAIRLDNMNSPLLIENNRIMYSGNAGIEISLQGSSAPPALVEIDIWNNMILGNGEDGIQFVDHPGDPQNTNRQFVLAGNLIANNGKAGLGLMPNANTLEDYSGADMAEAVHVFNNTFYGNDYGLSGGDNVVAFNNIFSNSRTRAAWRVHGAPNGNVPTALEAAPPRTSVVAYSLFHNNRIDAEETNLGAGVLLGVDPLFEAAPNPGPDGAWATVDDDFSGLVLRPNSPALDKGVAQFMTNSGGLVPPSPITGFAGIAPDLGWREFGAPIFPTPTPTLISSATPPLPTATVETLTPEPTLTSLPGSPIPTLESPTLVPTETLVPTTPTVTNSPSVTAAPTEQLTIQSIIPTSAQANTTVTVAITGSGFQPGAVVTFEGGQGLAQEVLAVQVINSSTIIVTMITRNDGASGIQVWDVRVTNPDQSTIVLADAFTVTPEA